MQRRLSFAPPGARSSVTVTRFERRALSRWLAQALCFSCLLISEEELAASSAL